MSFDQLLCSLSRLDHLQEHYGKLRSLGLRAYAAYVGAVLVVESFKRGIDANYVDVAYVLRGSSDSALSSVMSSFR